MEFKRKLMQCLWMLFTTYITAIDASLEEIERHLEMGKMFLSKGQFSDALTHYHAAVDLDPENYQTLFRRATVFLATGKSRSALPDLDKVLQLKPDFTSARLQRANVLLKQCELDAAYADYEQVLSKESGNEEAKQKLDQIGPARENVNFGINYLNSGDFQSAEFYLTKALDVCPWSQKLHEARAECYEQMGEIRKAIADVRGSAKLLPDSTEAFFKLSVLYYRAGDPDESLNQIRECLHLNPEHKKCFPHYKKLKKLVKQMEIAKEAIKGQKWDECVTQTEKVLTEESANDALAHILKVQLCSCMSKAGRSIDAIKYCTDVLEREETAETLCDRAEAYIGNEQIEDAIRDFEQAIKVNGELRRAQEGLQRAQKLLKQSKRRDYYKILGVRRNASKQQIMKAYRKMAQKWHPDNFREEAEKKAAEKKFIDIASAKEVLTDPEKRSRYDNGEDPLDPESQAHGGYHNPFFQGFNPFGNGGGGGGPFTFKFHFN